MSSIGSVFLRLGVKSDANKQLSGIFKGIQGQMLKFGAAFGAFNFIKTGVKQASDFAENWSVVTQAVGKDVQDSFMDAFSKLKRTSKTEFSEIAAMITGTFKSKGISDSIIKQMGPELMQRLEDTAAKFNVSTERAVEAFGSMMAGMTKPMKTLTKDAVVPLVENLDIFTEKEYGKKFKELAPDEQTLARMKFFLQETKKVPGLVTNSATTIGTFKGRLDSFKKSINDSSQAIAKNFMPTLAKVLEILSTLIKLISENITLFTTLIGI
ncbi:hypothetical protein AB0R99_00020 [Erwinia amylovora]|uniref:hypothetical protein n=1 Tax=Erwinia amylovora TaxID=552 RepID=UPI0037DDB973